MLLLAPYINVARVFLSCDHYCVAVVTLKKKIVIPVDPKVTDNSLSLFYYIYYCKFTKYQVCLHIIPTASNCKQCTDNG